MTVLTFSHLVLITANGPVLIDRQQARRVHFGV